MFTKSYRIKIENHLNIQSLRCSEKVPDYLLDFTSCPIDSNDDSHNDWGATHSTMNFFEMCSKIINKLANN